MERRRLGMQGLVTGALGLGCMGMSFAYARADETDEAESMATIHRALDRGITMFDTAEAYGPYRNEELLGKALRGRRDAAVIATKFGILGSVNGTPANARRVADESLRRLGVDCIDVFYLHRKDPAVPIEESVGGMAELVTAGKVRYLGLSEVGVDTLRRAHAVHPISVLQSEYSLWERGIEAEILPELRRLGIGLVPFCPLGRGFLAGAIRTPAALEAGDRRQRMPRFSQDNIARNLWIFEKLRELALRHSTSPARVALAWVLAQGAEIVPIPGTRRRQHLEDNLGAMDITLTAADFAELNGLSAAVAGDRYPEKMSRLAER